MWGRKPLCYLNLDEIDLSWFLLNNKQLFDIHSFFNSVAFQNSKISLDTVNKNAKIYLILRDLRDRQNSNSHALIFFCWNISFIYATPHLSQNFVNCEIVDSELFSAKSF